MSCVTDKSASATSTPFATRSLPSAKPLPLRCGNGQSLGPSTSTRPTMSPTNTPLPTTPRSRPSLPSEASTQPAKTRTRYASATSSATLKMTRTMMLSIVQQRPRRPDAAPPSQDELQFELPCNGRYKPSGRHRSRGDTSADHGGNQVPPLPPLRAKLQAMARTE